MSKQKKQITENNSNKKFYRDTEAEENVKIKPIVIIGFILYIVIGTICIFALIYLTNEIQGGKQ